MKGELACGGRRDMWPVRDDEDEVHVQGERRMGAVEGCGEMCGECERGGCQIGGECEGEPGVRNCVNVTRSRGEMIGE